MAEPFDAVAWMRKRRTEIDQEDEGLTWEERSKKTLKLLESDPLWCDLKRRVVKGAGLPVERAIKLGK